MEGIKKEIMYFRNKFHEEFLYLCNNIYPKGATTRIGTCSSLFFEFRQNPHTKTVKVIPLILYNKLKSTNPNDKNIEDYIMLSENKADTIIRAIYDERYTRPSEEYLCNLAKISGDFEEMK